MTRETKFPDDSIHLNQTYLQLLDSLNIGFSFMDMDFWILEVNETFLNMVGAAREQIVGHHASEFYEKEDFEKLFRIDLEGQQKNRFYQYEFFLPNAQVGVKIPALFHISTNFDAEGNPVSQYVMFSDIREQKKIQAELQQSNAALQESQQALNIANQDLAISRCALEREKQMLETILFGIGDCVTVYDDQGILLLNNPKGEKIRKARGIMELPASLDNTVDVSLKIDGRLRQFSGHVEKVCDHQGRVIAFAEILKDVTDRKKLEEKEQELVRMKRLVRRSTLKSEIIGISPAMQKVFELIIRCAEVDSTVLVLGETGVGKELVARAIHRQSNRRNMPFVTINCGALPMSLLETELFGHVKGAFTGAVSHHTGLFREAKGGTLFLDEVGDLDISLQVKVLRALQEKEVRPVGGTQSHPVDVRVIAATHRNLVEQVDRNRFRSDLYYRIAVIQLYIPPLRERKEDILPLAHHFIEKHNKKPKTGPISLDHEAQQLLLNAAWGGNVRELENSIEHALAMKSGTVITSENLPVQIVAGLKHQNESSWKTAATNPSADTQLKPWQLEEKQTIEKALIQHKGNRIDAASELGMSRSTLWRKMTMYRLAL
ncbi:sigma 54-interacting transcriptional regulator [bacterium]|nr:sigma 54-interacting transcriptional regulator [bacterium]